MEEVGRRLPTTSQVERPAAPVNLAQAQPMEVVSRFPMTAQVERPVAPVDLAPTQPMEAGLRRSWQRDGGLAAENGGGEKEPARSPTMFCRRRSGTVRRRPTSRATVIWRHQRSKAWRRDGGMAMENDGGEEDFARARAVRV
uniref:Uncharacterized protein n=1 Tax=Oryza glaberrima TaxID=4538 RepID=I1PHK8_ORYGL